MWMKFCVSVRVCFSLGERSVLFFLISDPCTCFLNLSFQFCFLPDSSVSPCMELLKEGSLCLFFSKSRFAISRHEQWTCFWIFLCNYTSFFANYEHYIFLESFSYPGIFCSPAGGVLLAVTCQRGRSRFRPYLGLFFGSAHGYFLQQKLHMGGRAFPVQWPRWGMFLSDGHLL